MSTTIESLELEITSNSTGAISGLNALSNTLERLRSATKGGLGLKSVANGISSVSTAANSVSANSVSKLSGLANAISTLGKTKLSNHLGTSISSLGNTTQLASTSFTNFYFKVRASIRVISILGKTIFSAIKQSNDYIESVNLFSVSLGEYADEAKRYAETVSEAMGIDPGEWMKTQGIFMTLATGFGVASDRAYTMSKNLTQLGYDLSSFFNISTEDAMQKLQSGLAGELEPLRRIGYDLSQTKLEATAKDLGIDKLVSEMNQAEKAQLRYYAIMTQVTTAHGDMARTIEAPANQLRVLKAQFNMAAREIGNIFIPMLNKVLPYVIAVVKVVRILASNVANLFGYKLPEVDYSGVVSMGNAAQDTSDALGESVESAKKLKSYMLGFDELNVINPNEGSESAAEDPLSGFNFDLPEYDFLAGLVESKVNIIVEEMKEWLGITEDIESWSDLLDGRLGDILTTVGAIAAGLALWKLSTGFVSALTMVQALVASPTYAITISVMLAIVGLAMSFDGLKKAVEDGLDGFNFAEIIGGSLLSVGSTAILGAKIATWITTAFSSSAVANALTTAAINLFGASGPVTSGAVAAAGGVLLAAVTAIIVGLPMYFVGIYDACVAGLDWLNGALIGVGATLGGAGIGAIIGMLGGPIGVGVGALIGLVIGLVTDLYIWLWQNFDSVTEWFLNLPMFAKIAIGVAATVLTFGVLPLILGVMELLQKWEGIKTFFAGVWDFLSPVFEAIGWVASIAIEKAGEIVGGVWNALKVIFAKVSEIVMKIVEIFVALGKAFYTYALSPIIEWITPLAKRFYEKVIAPVFEWIVWIKDEAIKIFKVVGAVVVNVIAAQLKSVINGVLTLIESTINGFIKLLNGAIDIINKIPGVSITQVSLLEIPMLAEGGFPEQGQMFIAREAGAEMVGCIGRRTAVANNDQIVAGIAGGVAEANAEQNALLREQNSLLMALLEKDSSVYIDGKRITDSVEKHQRERGRVLVTGGVL